MAKALIDAGADIHAKDGRGATPLHIAASNGHADMAKALIDAGADIHAKDKVGATPLHHAALGDETETAKALINAGADVNAEDDFGQTPLDFASPEAARVIRNAGRRESQKSSWLGRLFGR